MQQAHCDGFYPGSLELPYPSTHFVFIQSTQYITVGGGNAFVDRQPMSALDQGLGLPRQVLLQREVIWFLVTRNMQDVAKTFGRDHADLGTPVGQRGVRCNRGSVDHLVYFRQFDIGFFTQAFQPIDDCNRGVFWG